MADDKQTIRPSPKFYFAIQLGDGEPAKFQEVAGLQTEPGEFRHAALARIKMPGLNKSNDVTLRRGVVRSDSDLWNWLNDAKRGTVKRRTVTLSLHDESGKPAMAWRLNNARPTKIAAADLKAEGNEVAIETLELAHEGIDLTPA